MKNILSGCGIFSVMLLAVACSDSDRSTPEQPTELATPLTVPVPTLKQFVVLSRASATFGQRCIVTGGDIGVAPSGTATPNTLSGAEDSRLGVGEVLLAERVTLAARAATGELGANQIVAPASVITGPRSAFVAPPAIPQPPAVVAGTSNVTVNSGQTRTIAAGKLNNVIVSGTLNLSGGLYELGSLRVNADGRVVALADAALRVATTLVLADRARIVPAAPLGPSSLRLSIAGADASDNSLTLGADARFSALVVAARTVRTGDRAIMAGSVAARSVVFGNDSRLSFDAGFECSSNAGCDDGNPCSVDVCSDTRCSHSPAPSGTACSDGNGCTGQDKCQAGACSGSPVVCAALDQCHVAGSCNPSNGACSNPNKPDGAGCSDMNACTTLDACQAGSCVGAGPVACSAVDTCHLAGICDPASGACSAPPAPDGTGCDDGVACTQGDRCSAGTCAAGTDLAVDEFATGLTRPRSLVSGPGGVLWLATPETSQGLVDGSIASITTSGVVAKTAVARDVAALLPGPDGKLWVSERLLGGLSALGRFDVASRSMVGDFTGLQQFYDLAASNDHGEVIVWFTGNSSVGRITPEGQMLPVAPTFYVTRAITAAAAVPASTSVIWFTEANGGGFSLIGRLAFPHLQQFSVSTPGELTDIVEGPDGGIWFTDPSQNELGRMPPAGGVAQKFALPTAASGPFALTNGPDGNLWISLKTAGKLARVTPEGSVTEVCIPTAASAPTEVTAGPDGNVWFIESGSGKVGRVRLAPSH